MINTELTDTEITQIRGEKYKEHLFNPQFL